MSAFAYTDAAKEAARRCMCDALRAIRVPDERVLEAMRDSLMLEIGCSQPIAGCLDGRTTCVCLNRVAVVWQAGIDAVMEDGK